MSAWHRRNPDRAHEVQPDYAVLLEIERQRMKEAGYDPDEKHQFQADEEGKPND